MADHITVPSVTSASGRRVDSAWAPLREPLFRSLWIAAVVSYTGTWMQNVGAGWLMTELTTSPLIVSLVQAASAIPVFLVVLPAGALADIVDRRRLLLFTQGWMVVAAAALGILTLLGAVNPWMLLVFTNFIENRVEGIADANTRANLLALLRLATPNGPTGVATSAPDSTK